MSDAGILLLYATGLALICAGLIAWNITLHIKIAGLRLELLQRQVWHDRELRKLREKI